MTKTQLHKEPVAVSYPRIVVGTDGSAGSRAAVEWAGTIAAVADSHVILVHGLAPLLEIALSIPPLPGDELIRLARAELSGPWCEPLRAAGVDFEVVLVEASGAAALVSSAQDASLLILGRHGHTEWAPHVMGGVAHKVLTKATCPVAVVPPDWSIERHPDRDIVVGVDGSEASLAALDWAIHHAELFDLRVRIVTSVFTRVLTEVPWLAAADAASATKAAQEVIGRFVDERRAGTSVELETQVTVGHPGASLATESTNSELVVVGARGIGAVAEFLTGSTSHYIAARSAAPTVIVTDPVVEAGEAE